MVPRPATGFMRLRRSPGPRCNRRRTECPLPERRAHRLRRPWPRAHVHGIRPDYSGPVHDPVHDPVLDPVLDERHVGDDDLPSDNLTAAVIDLEQSRSPVDLVRVVDASRDRLRDPRDWPG